MRGFIGCGSLEGVQTFSRNYLWKWRGWCASVDAVLSGKTDCRRRARRATIGGSPGLLRGDGSARGNSTKSSIILRNSSVLSANLAMARGGEGWLTGGYQGYPDAVILNFAQFFGGESREVFRSWRRFRIKKSGSKSEKGRMARVVAGCRNAGNLLGVEIGGELRQLAHQ